MLTDTIQSAGGLTLSVVPEEGAWRGHSSYLGVCCPRAVHYKQKLNAVFALDFFFL